MRFGQSAPQPAPPVEEPEPIRIPSASDPDLVAAGKRRLRMFSTRRAGRASTELTDETRSGGAYSRTTLG